MPTLKNRLKASNNYSHNKTPNNALYKPVLRTRYTQAKGYPDTICALRRVQPLFSRGLQKVYYNGDNDGGPHLNHLWVITMLLRVVSQVCYKNFRLLPIHQLITSASPQDSLVCLQFIRSCFVEFLLAGTYDTFKLCSWRNDPAYNYTPNTLILGERIDKIFRVYYHKYKDILHCVLLMCQQHHVPQYLYTV